MAMGESHVINQIKSLQHDIRTLHQNKIAPAIFISIFWYLLLSNKTTNKQNFERQEKRTGEHLRTMVIKMKKWFAGLLNSLTNKHEKRIAHAIAVIEQHGMRAHLYLPVTGCHTDSERELALALTVLRDNGFIITDGQGEIVGKVSTHGLSSEEIAMIRRASFKIVDEI